MELSYNPGELDYKKSQKESSSGMKRDHDSMDDFEHLDPESSPVDILTKPLSEIDSKSNNGKTTSLKNDFSDLLSKNDLPKSEESTFDSVFSNGKNTVPDITLDSKQLKANVESNIKTNLLDFEIASDNLPKEVETVPVNALNSNFISAEKASDSIKTDSESDLVGLETNVKDNGKVIEILHEDGTKSTKNEDFGIPAKSMKEADAMSHYEIKIEKREMGEKDGHSQEDKGTESLVKPEPTKEQDNIEHILRDDPLEVDTPYKDLIIHDGDYSEINGSKYSEKKEEFSPSYPESEPLDQKPFVVKPQSAEELVIEKNKDHEEPKDFPSADDINKHRVCICPSKPESAVSDLDDIIGPEDVFKRIGLDAWFTPGRLHPIVEALVYWRDPKKSGVVFGGVMAILLSLCYMSLISVVAYSSLLALIGTICFRIYKNILQAVQKTSEGHPFKEFLDLQLSLPQDKVREITDTAVVHINAAIVELRRLFLVEDLIDSIKFGVCLWCLTYVGAIFNGMTIVILAFVALFSVPKIYENNKATIDTYIDIGRSKVAEITSKVKAAVPIGKKEPEKDKEQ